MAPSARERGQISISRHRLQCVLTPLEDSHLLRMCEPISPITNRHEATAVSEPPPGAPALHPPPTRAWPWG